MPRVDVNGLMSNLGLKDQPGSLEPTSRRFSLRDRIRGNGSHSVTYEWKDAPRIIIANDTPDFDPIIVSHFQEEGFQVSYLGYAGDPKAFNHTILHLSDDLEAGDKYAIVACNEAAALCLEACVKGMPKLVALVAYYPSHTPASNAPFPLNLLVQIHLAASQNFGTQYPHYRYEGTVPGFAEHDLDEYDKTSASVAWSRTIGVLRRAFDINVDLEEIWDNHTRLEFVERDADKTMATMVSEPYVNHIPTMTGGIGAKDLRRFYADFFIPNNPESMKLKLLSRTVGTDRVVDEMLCTFRHTCEIPWMLPGVPATDKLVEVIVVGIICIRGGKLYHEHLHWDQASVLVQIGLLDPTLVPPTFKTTEEGKEKSVKRLPVMGAEAARKAVDENVGKSNELIPGW